MPAGETLDLNRLVQRLKELGKPPLRFEPLFARLKVLLLAQSKRCFSEQRGPDGSPWAPLKRPRDRKRDRRARGGGGQKALRDTGALMNSVTAEQTGPLTMDWGSGLQYAAAQNDGATVRVPERRRDRPWVFTAPDGKAVFTRHIRAHQVTIPPRPFVGLSRELAETVAEMAGEHVLHELNRRGIRS